MCTFVQVFSNCSCVGEAGNLTANTGQCPDKEDCDRMFPFFLALSVLTSFIISLGGTPGYMLLIRSALAPKLFIKLFFLLIFLIIEVLRLVSGPNCGAGLLGDVSIHMA